MTNYLVVAFFLAVTLIAAKAIRDFYKASKHYSIVKRCDNWIVRDKRGRFVRITDNYWDICALGASL